MDNILKDINSELKKVVDSSQLEEIRVKYFSKKGIISSLALKIKDQSHDQRGIYGKKVNDIKKAASKVFEDKREQILHAELSANMIKQKIDITQPGYIDTFGTIHPLNQVINQIADIMKPLGYSVRLGREIVSDLDNFELLNIDKDHPARAMQDTFYFNPEQLLRTHTSHIQIESLKELKTPPIKVVYPGRVFRRDDDDATHSHQFTQMEGLFVGENVTMADLKATLTFIIKKLFGENLKTRFRPSYFPFTEPSLEVDMSCFVCKQEKKECSICKSSGWIEILGGGMVHPQVLENCNIDSKKYTGFAFGMGIDRITMLKYNIKDIRDFYKNDLRFNKQFRKVF